MSLYLAYAAYVAAPLLPLATLAWRTLRRQPAAWAVTDAIYLSVPIYTAIALAALVVD